MSLAAEVSQLRTELASLRRQVEQKWAPPAAVEDGTFEDCENASGTDINLGDWVEISGIGSSGHPTIQRPSEESSAAALGVAGQNIPTGSVGKVQTCGLAIASVKGTESPSAGDPVGTQQDSFIGSSEQRGGGYFMAWVRKLSSLAWVLLQKTDMEIVIEHAGPTFGQQVSDPRGTTRSTPVKEYLTTKWPTGQGFSTVWTGYTHDILKVQRPYGSPRSPGDYSVGGAAALKEKLMISALQSGPHDEGWVIMDVQETYAGRKVGWGVLWDVMCAERAGWTMLNIKTGARFNDAPSGLVGPIYFDGAETWFLNQDSGRPWIQGKMTWDGKLNQWRPAVPYIVDMYTCTTMPWRYTDSGQDCNCLAFPYNYQKLFNFKVYGPRDPTTSLTNYLEVICCNRDDINLIFRLLQALDYCYSWKVQSIDAYLMALDMWLLNAFGVTSSGNYPAVIKCLDALHSNVCNSAALPYYDLDYVSICIPNVPYDDPGYGEDDMYGPDCERLKKDGNKAKKEVP